MSDERAGLSGNLRFFASLAPAVVLILGSILLVADTADRVPGAAGILLGIVSAVTLALGILLIYYNAIDARNLRLVRDTGAQGSPRRDGKVLAVCGVARTDTPLTAPFAGEPCAAYAYVVSASRFSSRRRTKERVVLAEGFHLAPTRIESPDGDVEIRGLPSVEDDLRREENGGAWGGKAVELMKTLSESAPASGQRERSASLLEARHSEIRETHRDYVLSTWSNDGSDVAVQEEIVPTDVEVCVIGTYDGRAGAITPRKGRLGPNLMIYRGSRKEMLERVGNDVAWFRKATAILLAIGLLTFAAPRLPRRVERRAALLRRGVGLAARVRFSRDQVEEVRALVPAAAARLRPRHDALDLETGARHQRLELGRREVVGAVENRSVRIARVVRVPLSRRGRVALVELRVAGVHVVGDLGRREIEQAARGERVRRVAQERLPLLDTAHHRDDELTHDGAERARLEPEASRRRDVAHVEATPRTARGGGGDRGLVMSTPVTSNPASVSERLTSPVPQPRSSTRAGAESAATKASSSGRFVLVGIRSGS